MTRPSHAWPLAGVALALVACRPPDPAAAAYGAERLRCVEVHDAAARARDCIRHIDTAYDQDPSDGGRP